MPSYGSNDGYGRQMLREDRSSIRQSKTYRQYESGNAIKSMLGMDHLQWDTSKTGKLAAVGAAASYDSYNNLGSGGGRRPLYGRRSSSPAAAPVVAAYTAAAAAVAAAEEEVSADLREGKVSPPRATQPPPVPRALRAAASVEAAERSLGEEFARTAAITAARQPPPPAAAAAAYAAPPPAAARPGAATGFDPLGDAMWQAVGARDFTEVDRLLRRGADPNMVCPDGWVTEAARPRDGSIGRSLLHHAAWAGDLNVFKLLVAAGGDVGRQRNTAWRPNGGVRGRGATPLHHAVMYGREDIVAYLVDEEGADINAPGEQGYTALHLAAKFNYPRLVHYLLERGARTDMLTRDEKTARELAGAKQERSHAQMGNMLETFDRYDAAAKSRPKLLPGAPLPPDPRLAAAPEPSPAPASWTAGASPARAPLHTYGGGGGGANYQPAQAAPAPPLAGRRGPPLARGAEPTVRIFSKRPRGWSTQPNAPLYPADALPRPNFSLLQKPPKLTPEHHAATHQGLRSFAQPYKAAALKSPEMRPDQAADAEAALIRARSRGQRALW